MAALELSEMRIHQNINDSNFKTYIKFQMDMIEKIFEMGISESEYLLKSMECNIKVYREQKIQESEQVCLLKSMEITIKNYREEQLLNYSVLDEFHEATFGSIPSEYGYGIKLRDIISKFKEWSGKMNTSNPPAGKDVCAYFEKKYGKYPKKTGWLNFSYKQLDLDEFGLLSE